MEDLDCFPGHSPLADGNTFFVFPITGGVRVRPDDAWNQFLKTGSVNDYIAYRKISMLSQRLQDESEAELANADQNEGNYPEGAGQWG